MFPIWEAHVYLHQDPTDQTCVMLSCGVSREGDCAKTKDMAGRPVSCGPSPRPSGKPPLSGVEPWIRSNRPRTAVEGLLAPLMWRRTSSRFVFTGSSPCPNPSPVGHHPRGCSVLVLFVFFRTSGLLNRHVGSKAQEGHDSPLPVPPFAKQHILSSWHIATCTSNAFFGDSPTHRLDQIPKTRHPGSAE